MRRPAVETHAAVTALIPRYFQLLGVCATLASQRAWREIHSSATIIQFEVEHGLEAKRFAYNERNLALALRSKRAVTTQHVGLTDLFVPVVRQGKAHEAIVIGPVRRGPPSSTEVHEHWRALTGTRGQLSDPEFSSFLNMWLATPLLEDSRLDALRRLVTAMAELLSGEGEVSEVSARATKAWEELIPATFVPRMWEAAHSLSDPRTLRALIFTPDRRQSLNLRGVPDYALAGFLETSGDSLDPVAEYLQRHEFQRACVALSRALGNVVTGPIGNHGVTFLVAPEKSEARTRSRLLDISERASHLARRRFGLRLHVGIGATTPGSLSGRLENALAAAEKALAEGAASATVPAVSASFELTLRNARTELSNPTLSSRRLAARFERYVKLVAIQCGYRVEPAAAHLEAGFERLAEPFVVNGALERSAYDRLGRSLGRAARSANTFDDLIAKYREAVGELEELILRPSRVHQERSLERAVAHVRDHLAEPLTLRAVAQVAGFAPNYFSRLFKDKKKVTFERYLRDLRIERAKHLLGTTSFSAERVAQLSGFGSNQYFHRVFREVVGDTPLQFRKRPN